ncbi:MAG: TPM domain-containing protein [Bacteroidetes bacterium]|nr:TPM domain-containing protein [Bacteroidota bacterium]
MAEKKFSERDRQKILSSIKEAEQNTSGEIRLFIEDDCGDHVLDRAAFIFQKMKMHETQHRNGVLFYLAFESRQFAILGDSGIHSIVKDDFWHDIKLEMQHHFTEGDFVTGLSKGIRMAGEALKKNFPHQKDDKNELPDDIVFGGSNNE